MFWEGGWEWARLIGSYDTLGQTPHFFWLAPSLFLAEALTSGLVWRGRPDPACVSLMALLANMTLA